MNNGVVGTKVVNKATPTICLQGLANTKTPSPNRNQSLNNDCSASTAQPNPQRCLRTNNLR